LENSVQILSGNTKSLIFYIDSSYKIPDNMIIEIEINPKNSSIFFFLNHRQCSYYICNICWSSYPLLFGISGCNTTSAVIINSVQKLVKPISNTFFECRKIEWKFSNNNDNNNDCDCNNDYNNDKDYNDNYNDNFDDYYNDYDDDYDNDNNNYNDNDNNNDNDNDCCNDYDNEYEEKEEKVEEVDDQEDEY
jgi:hypothetical protein